jgi:hypothetical protein
MVICVGFVLVEHTVCAFDVMPSFTLLWRFLVLP